MNSNKFKCSFCNSQHYSGVSLRKHLAETHYCYKCRKNVINKSHHRCIPVQFGHGSFDPSPFVLTQTSLDSFQVYSISVGRVYVSIEQLIRKYYNDIFKLCIHLLTEHKNIKARIVVQCHLIQQKNNEEKLHDIGSSYDQILNRNQIKPFIYNQTSHIIRRLNFYNENGSAWSVLKLPRLDLHVAKFDPLRIGNAIPTPSCFKQKHGLINLKTRNNLCFPYCIIACYKKIKTVREAKMKIFHDFMRENYDEVSRKCLTIDFTCLPNEGFVDLEDIIKFEKCNPNFSVNVFAHENESVYPLQLSSNKKEKQHHADLLLITDTNNNTYHLILIVDFDTFMSKSDGHKRYFCKRCLQSFGSVEHRKCHLKVCEKYSPQRIEFPEEDSVNYTMGGNEIAQEFYVVADFETYMQVYINESHKNRIVIFIDELFG